MFTLDLPRFSRYARYVTIQKDTKDWTWVLDRACPECSFDTSAVLPERVGAMVRENSWRWRPLLARSDAKRRPSEDVWSALEYACHVRDVFSVYDMRLERMLAEEDPLYPNWDQDETAIEQCYGEQDPLRVSDELEEAGARLAGRFDAVSGVQWERTGRRGDGAQFTIESFARYMIHDPVHHLYDVERGLGILAGRQSV